MVNIPSKHRALYRFVHSLEESCARHVDVLVTVGEELLRTFQKRPSSCALIMNLPEDHVDKIKTRAREENNKNLQLVYAGIILQDPRI